MSGASFFGRRSFLAGVPVAVCALARQSQQAGRDSAPAASFPLQDRELVREVVGASHRDLDRVKTLVGQYPTLARASWDWGFGDHEAAIDAASHVGNRPIAEFLIAHGARPTIFTAAMLGHLAVVRGLVEALPGVQRMRGPHGITLLAHARAGGSAAGEVVKYLEQLGDANPVYVNEPIPPAEDAALPGEYVSSSQEPVRLRVTRNSRGDLTIARPGVMAEHRLFHQGGLVFVPAGAEAVTIRFTVTPATAVTLVVKDGPVTMAASRVGPATAG